MFLPDGLIAIVKRDCPTCTLVEPVLQALEASGRALTVYCQDDPAFPATGHVLDDRDLEISYRLAIDTVPTLIAVDKGVETARLVGWERDEWRAFTGVPGLGEGLPGYRPGCGSLSVQPGIVERLAVRHGSFTVRSRALPLPEFSDAEEYCFERGWSDGLPVVPPTAERIYRMLTGTTRAPDEVLGRMPPLLTEVTVEKVAINAVLAGCKPEYLPVVLAAVEAALDPAFCLHGLLATTWFAGPMIVVSGPARRALGMNWAGNVLGQGNRANATIGRALQLAVRNIGGGKPQDTDMSTFGHPGKLGFCFAEDEDTPWTTLGEDRGVARDRSAVTLFSADGPIGCVDQKSRTPEDLVYSLAGALRAVDHVDLVNGADVVVVIGPEHGRVFDLAGWNKARTTEALQAATHIPGRDFGMGTAAQAARSADDGLKPKFRPGGITLVRAGGPAGLFSAIIPGWLVTGELGTDPVTREILA